MCANGRHAGNATVDRQRAQNQLVASNGSVYTAADFKNQAGTYSVPKTFSADLIVFDKRDPDIDWGGYQLSPGTRCRRFT